MSCAGMMRDILAQPRSLARVLERQSGPGRAALEEAACLLRRAPAVIVSGMGGSYCAGLALGYALGARGKMAVPVESAELLYHLHPLARGAATVLVSRSGESIEVVKLIPLLRAAGARIVAVTNVAGSTLEREADVALIVGSPADEMVAVQTYTGALLTLLLLGEAAAGGPEPSGARLPDEAASTLQACLEQAAAWDEFLGGASSLYLLGRGSGVASASEGALLFHEAARFPAVAMPAGYFRHGPIEVVEPGFRAVIFAGGEPVRALNLALAADLCSIGGRVAVVGPDAPAGCLLWKTPESPRFAPLLDILPVQIAACRFAGQRGIAAGDFRFATEVTLAEAGLGR